MKPLNGKRLFFLSLATITLSASMTSCGLMHDDLEECATRPSIHTSVRFVYDYNTQADDMFNDHVGAVTLYLFDQSGNYLSQIEKSNLSTGNALKSEDFKIDIDLQPGKYNLYAVAQGNQAGYEASLGTPGAKFRRCEISGSNKVEDFLITLDHNNGRVEHNNVLIDTLWTTLSPQTIEIPVINDPIEGDVQQPDVVIEASVPLMRVTKHISITFWQSDYPYSIDPSHYDIKIEYPQGNGTMDICGDLKGSQALTYTPFKVWNETENIDGNNFACVKAEFGISRMMLNANARLVITNRLTGHTTRIDYLPKLLANGREAYNPFPWSEQEYLDREYEYDISFPLGDPIPKWVNLYVNILDWAKRIQYTDL